MSHHTSQRSNVNQDDNPLHSVKKKPESSEMRCGVFQDMRNQERAARQAVQSQLVPHIPALFKKLEQAQSNNPDMRTDLIYTDPQDASKVVRVRQKGPDEIIITLSEQTASEKEKGPRGRTLHQFSTTTLKFDRQGNFSVDGGQIKEMVNGSGKIRPVDLAIERSTSKKEIDIISSALKTSPRKIHESTLL